MPRAATNAAQNQVATTSGNAASEFGPLSAQAGKLINSPGYDPTTLAAITNAGMGGVNSAFGDASGKIQRNAAMNKNEAGTAGQLDALAMQKGVAGGREAGDIQMQNAGFQNQQRMAGVNLLNSMYGTNTGAVTPAINAETSASPGWAQTATGLMSGVGGMFAPRK